MPDINDFESELKKLIDTAKEQAVNEAFNQIQNLIDSPDSEEFTINMNQYFVRENIKDENGNILKVETPFNFKERLVWGLGLEPLEATFSISEEEERWFRMDQVYGRKIIEQPGFKYISMERE